MFSKTVHLQNLKNLVLEISFPRTSLLWTLMNLIICFAIDIDIVCGCSNSLFAEWWIVCLKSLF